MIRRLAGWLRDEHGAIAPLLVLLLIPMIGMMAMGGEVSSWYMKQRQIQNAADAAALAAATNNVRTDVNGIPSYQREAFAAAGQYGYQHLTTGTVQVAPTITDCPGSAAGANDCYQVAIQQKVPLYLTQIVGYKGNATIGSTRMATLIQAVAIARPPGIAAQYCMVGLAKTGESFRVNGGSKLDFNGCSALGGSNINCNGNGSDEGMPYGDAVGASDCGATARPNQFTTAQFDSIMAGFPSYMSYIPSATCGTVAINTWTTVSTLNTSTPYCGGIKLNNDIVVTGTGNTLTVYDGGINLNGHKISTGTGADLTIIFTGTTHNIPGQKNNDPKWAHNFVGTGVIDIQAPISGNLKGVALMQNPNMAGNADDLDFNYSGNNPELFVSGLWYTPKSNFLIGGSINMHTDGKSCIGVIALTIQTNGTGKIFDHATSECANFVDLPKIPGTNSRQALVQ